MTELGSTERLVSSVNRGAPLRSLFAFVGQAHRARAPRARLYDLDAVGEIRIGRGDVDSEETDAGGVLDVRIADPGLSGRHARIVRVPSPHGPPAFILEDRSSTNGCFVDGQRAPRRRPLVDGEVVEMGRTFFRFIQRAVADGALDNAYVGGEREPLSSLCPALLAQLSGLDRISASGISLLIAGETGTGKEVLAEDVHRRSGRSGRFVALNCAALPDALVESELFGHRRGSFTGADADKAGLVERAEAGTLLLDEVGDMAAGAQAKLLRLLQERSFTRLGETAPRRADVRFVAATHKNLPALIEAGTFRADLYARLNGVTLELPPLRERREDMGLLIAALVARHRPGDDPIVFSHEAYRALMLYGWPYNVRELDKAIEGALARTDDAIDLPHLPPAVRAVVMADAATTANAPTRDDPLLRGELVRALCDHKGNVSAVARQMDTTRMQVHRWMKRLALDADDYRP